MTGQKWGAAEIFRDWKEWDWLMILCLLMLTGLCMKAFEGYGLYGDKADALGLASGAALWFYFRVARVDSRTAAALTFGAVVLAGVLATLGGLVMPARTAEGRADGVAISALTAALAWRKELLSRGGDMLSFMRENEPAPEAGPEQYFEAVEFFGLREGFTRAEMMDAYDRIVSSAPESGDPRLAVKMANDFVSEIERVRRNEPGWKEAA